MKFYFILAIAVILVAAMMTTPASADKGCMGCTVVVSIITQIAANNPGIKIDKAAGLWCRALGSQDWIVNVCTTALSNLIPQIQKDVDSGRTPDQTCAALSLCTGDDLKCQLWKATATTEADFSPLSTTENEQFHEFFTEADSIFQFVMSSMIGWSELNHIKPSLENYPAILKHKPQSMEEQKVSDAKWYLRPWVDLDGDGHSTINFGRGSDWRGQDCNDLDPLVYPGRRFNNKGADNDHNCNGIYGTNPQTGQSYESELCNIPQWNFLSIGDSATAHFSLPPCWLSGQCAGRPEAYAQLFNIVANEVDWPMCSAYTGFMRDGTPSQCPSLYKSITDFQSLYNYARERNPCIHRSYFTAAVNGASSKNVMGSNKDGIMMTVTPDQQNDHPFAVFYQLIGNDVCGKSSDVDSMTQPDEYRAAIMESLQYLDTVLPAGSRVWLGGLVKGSALFDAMGHQHHPIGPITYGAFYDYLNCFKTSPCAGWLNTDPAVRLRTDQHAIKLNAVAKDIAVNSQFKNFEIRYNDIFNKIDTIFNEIQAAGFSTAKLVAETDGFHPSSTLNALLAKKIIAQISESDSTGNAIFTLNPNRDMIYKLFGNNLNGY